MERPRQTRRPVSVDEVIFHYNGRLAAKQNHLPTLFDKAVKLIDGTLRNRGDGWKDDGIVCLTAKIQQFSALKHTQGAFVYEVEFPLLLMQLLIYTAAGHGGCMLFLLRFFDDRRLCHEQ